MRDTWETKTNLKTINNESLLLSVWEMSFWKFPYKFIKGKAQVNYWGEEKKSAIFLWPLSFTRIISGGVSPILLQFHHPTLSQVQAAVLLKKK